MAIRQTTHVLKNSDIVNRPLPSSLKAGEPIINTADGILYFSGVTTSTNEWTPAGTGTTANFFEVGSNLYDLQLRNRLTEYEGTSGAGLVGKFLSGTTNGFVIADIADIATSTDSYVTGGTFNDTTDTITLNLNLGRPSVNITGITSAVATGLTWNPNQLTLSSSDGSSVTATIDTFSALTVNGTLDVTGNTTLGNTTATTIDATTIYSGGTDLSTLISGSDTFATGFTYNNANSFEITGNNQFTTLNALFNTVTGLTVNGDLTVTGTTTLADINAVGDFNITGNTVMDGNLTVNGELNVTGDTTLANVTATTLDATTIYSGGTDLSTLISGSDTYATGYTYTPATNTFTISGNNQFTTINAALTSVSGLTFSNLTAGRVVYVGAGGALTDDAGFTYDGGTNTLSIPSDGTMNVGTGGLNVDGDTVIQGSLTVFGASVSAFTSQLYVEDDNITLNYNPTGSTIATSVGAGWTIQDGNGIASGDVDLEIVRMQNFTGLTASEIPDITEYTALTGYANRAWITQLNDLVIRSTDVTDGGTAGDFNGVRVG